MSATRARHRTSTALAAVTLVLALSEAAQAAPPVCSTPPAQTAVEGSYLQLYGSEYCSDADLDELIYEVADAPDHGTVTVFDSFLIYVPTAPYQGQDSFSFTATDGTTTTPAVTVAVTVVPNQPPECSTPVSLEAEPDTTTAVYPYSVCTDDGFSLTFELVTLPDHGTVADDPFGGLTYEPNAGYRGPDTFTFTANDGVADSNLVTVNVTVLGPNHAPTCVTPIEARVAVGGSLPLDHRSACSDPDGDSISPELSPGPATAASCS